MFKWRFRNGKNMVSEREYAAASAEVEATVAHCCFEMPWR
jgi:hypothetical protein